MPQQLRAPARRAAVEATAGAPGVTRRSALALGLTALVTGCTTGIGDLSAPTTSRPSSAPLTRTGPPSTQVTWATWPDYIDVNGEGSGRPTLDAFVKRSGIAVTYREVIKDNEQYVESISEALVAKRPVGADVMTLTSWMAARIVQAGWAQPFGPVPNGKNLIAALAGPDWDPDQRFSLPWQAGFTGVAYDARRIGRAIGSVSELFSRDDLKGRVGLLTEFPDTVGLTMLAQGRDLTTASVDGVEATLDYLRSQTTAGRFAGYYGNDVIDALGSGEIAAAFAWSGDVLQAQLENPYLKFVLPEEGLMIWADNLVVPASSTHADAVAALADYYYEPAVAASVAAWVNYICPVQGAQEEMDKIDPDLAASPLIFPDTSILDRSYQFPALAAAQDEALRKTFDGIVAARPA